MMYLNNIMGLRYFIVIIFMINWLSTPGLADCDLSKKRICDECIKCGGKWCKDPNESRRCVPLTGGGDEWCPDHTETADPELGSRDGAVFSPVYNDVLAEINTGKVTELRVHGNAVESIKTAYFKILSTTKRSDPSKVHVNLETKQSTIKVSTKISVGFCSPSSDEFEYVDVEVGMEGVGEKALLKYVVPCGCGCSRQVETGAQQCNGFGDLACGTCRCNKGRRGKFCECGPESSSCADSTMQKCSGNGYCDKCNKCQCSNNKEGSQYFDQEDNCKDLSSTVTEYLDCQKNTQVPCGKCDRDVFFHKWNPSFLNKLFDDKRKLWVDLGTKLPGYWGSVIDSTIHIMRKPQC